MQCEKIAVVILNWNGSSFLRQFLPSVVAYSGENATIVVADNGSTDDSRSLIETAFPTVKYLQLEKNYGFAEGYNRALQQIEANYYLLLNSDVRVTDGYLTPMVRLMEEHPAIGICQPKILSTARPDEFEYAGASGGFIDRYGYPFCRGRILQEVEKDGGQYDDAIPIGWASGACMLVRSDLWHECNGFDADFWAHMEEIDLCWRAHLLGYQAFVVPAAVVYHVGGGTLNYNNPLKIYLNFRNNLYLLFKNLPGKLLISRLFTRMILDGMAAFVFLLKGEFGSFRKVFAAHLTFYKSLPSLIRKRREIQRKRKLATGRFLSNTNLLWNYFVLKRRRYETILPTNKRG